MKSLADGIYPAAITPFLESGLVDQVSALLLMARFKDAGCAGVVLAGTNGEGPSLSTIEKRDLVRVAVAADILPVILGVATASLEEAIWSIDQAARAGAATALLMPPAYFREASQEGITAWFFAVMNRTSLPILLYNIPARTGIALSVETVAECAKHDHMAGIKDSSGVVENLQLFADALSGMNKNLFVGDESLLLKALDCGWSGSISGAANVIPRWLCAIAAEAHGERESAETKFSLVQPIITVLRTGPQPGLNKSLLAKARVIPRADLRLPLRPVSDQTVSSAWDLASSYMA